MNGTDFGTPIEKLLFSIQGKLPSTFFKDGGFFGLMVGLFFLLKYLIKLDSEID